MSELRKKISDTVNEWRMHLPAEFIDRIHYILQQPAPPPPHGRTVRVRVAAAVDHDGFWSALGWPNADGEDMREACANVGDGEARYWITAELPIPKPGEVETQVEVVE